MGVVYSDRKITVKAVSSTAKAFAEFLFGNSKLGTAAVGREVVLEMVTKFKPNEFTKYFRDTTRTHIIEQKAPEGFGQYSGAFAPVSESTKQRRDTIRSLKRGPQISANAYINSSNYARLKATPNNIAFSAKDAQPDLRSIDVRLASTPKGNKFTFTISMDSFADHPDWINPVTQNAMKLADVAHGSGYASNGIVNASIINIDPHYPQFTSRGISVIIPGTVHYNADTPGRARDAEIKSKLPFHFSRTSPGAVVRLTPRPYFLFSLEEIRESFFRLLERIW